MKRRKENERTRKEFIKDAYKFAKSIFTESKSGTLKCTKEELEAHLKEIYSDPDRKKRLQYISNLNKSTRPGTPFDMSDIKKREVDEFITKACSESSPGNDGVSYKVYKKCPRLRNSLFMLLRNMWGKKSVAKRWEMAEGIYLPKEVKSETLGQFRPISLLNIDGKIMFGIIAKRIISFVRNNGYVDESVQ